MRDSGFDSKLGFFEMVRLGLASGIDVAQKLAMDVGGTGDFTGLNKGVVLFEQKHRPVAFIVGYAPMRAADERGVERDDVEESAQAEFFAEQVGGDTRLWPADFGIEEKFRQDRSRPCGEYRPCARSRERERRRANNSR